MTGRQSIDVTYGWSWIGLDGPRRQHSERTANWMDHGSRQPRSTAARYRPGPVLLVRVLLGRDDRPPTIRYDTYSYAACVARSRRAPSLFLQLRQAPHRSIDRPACGRRRVNPWWFFCGFARARLAPTVQPATHGGGRSRAPAPGFLAELRCFLPAWNGWNQGNDRPHRRLRCLSQTTSVFK